MKAEEVLNHARKLHDYVYVQCQDKQMQEVCLFDDKCRECPYNYDILEILIDKLTQEATNETT